jgi:transglutaminase-like putative cysteine protease
MLIQLGYDIIFDVPRQVPIVALLNVHPSREGDLCQPDIVRVDPDTPVETFLDSFGNRSCRFVAEPGPLRLSNLVTIRDNGQPDPVSRSAREIPVEDLPHDALRYLLNSRYCEVDKMSNIAAQLFGGLPHGWDRVQAVCSWAHNWVKFGYQFANSTKTASDVYNDRCGVCRALNIPARYATGYLGDIGVPPSDVPMDFSAWFEVYLEDRWWTFDARHNQPRTGRVLMAVGRDASDVAITTSFGTAMLRQFIVHTDEVRAVAAD